MLDYRLAGLVICFRARSARERMTSPRANNLTLGAYTHYVIYPFACVTALMEEKNVKRCSAETSTITTFAFSYRAAL